MYNFRGRGGPSKGTPANVQCQKCLQRGHYSYECKASSQERPYVSRPSRSQQLRNPKLVPKLTEDAPTSSEKKKGTADQEIAKLEAERAKKSHIGESEEELDRSVAKRGRSRSPSSESVSTISTRASRSPPRKSLSHSPPPGKSDQARSHQHNADGSHSPPARRRRSLSKDSRSPPRRPERRHRTRDDDKPPRRSQRERSPRRARRYSSTSAASKDPRSEEPPRERSLSPFSRRQALTREMNSSGR